MDAIIKHVAITPSDTAILVPPVDAVFAAPDGTVALTAIDDITVTYPAVGGYILGPFKKVMATGSTGSNATSVIGIIGKNK